MLAAIAGEPSDYVPCSFMLYAALLQSCKTQSEFTEKQLALGLDAYVHVGKLEHSLHPQATCREWTEGEAGQKYFHRRIDTPAGPLTTRVRQWHGWPTEDNFPLFNDWLVPRTEEVLVKPEQDLEKLKYLFGAFRDGDIANLKSSAAEAKRIADEHQLLLVGGWRGLGAGIPPERRGNSESGVMGCDAMAWLSGYESIMLLSLTEPEIIREYAGIIHEWNLRQIQIHLDIANPDLIIRRGWYETTEFWTPHSFRTIIAPTLKAEARLVHQAGKKFGYIITSAFMPLIDDILDADIDVLIGLDPEEGKGTDVALVKSKVQAKKKALWGGVSGAVTVEQGSAGETESAVAKAVDLLGKGGGFILSPVDNVRQDTLRAKENTAALINAWKRHREISG